MTVDSSGPGAASGQPDPLPPAIHPQDPRYDDLALRRRNERFTHRPDYFRVVRTTDQAVAAVAHAVRSGQRIGIRSGGHSMENSVGEQPGGVIIDMAAMNGIYYDSSHHAFVVEAGATLGAVFRQLYVNWGVTVPGGWGHTVCVGGHVQGGGYGVQSRRLGSIVDYLDAVEVVTVDGTGTARATRASRDPADPNHDLWWAHTGGGGGNFGVVTRYWLRSPAATGNDPTTVLPRPPASLLTGIMTWSWQEMNRDSFHRLMRNYSAWHERNSAPGSPCAGLAARLTVSCRQEKDGPGDIVVVAISEAGEPGSRDLLKAFFAAVGDGVGGNMIIDGPKPWLYTMMPPVEDAESQRGAEHDRYKGKSGYLRRGFTADQVDTVYEYLGTPHPQLEHGALWLLSYGGQVNAVSPTATALVQRDSVLKAVYTATWLHAEDDEKNLDWIRRFYRDVYGDSGGVPVPGEVSDGAYINYPDADLADPRWNTSGVPWHHLYYKENYPRLQRVKARWDPADVFHHTLSIRPSTEAE
ncbi:FAD-binding oxidoreductase [Parafrankia sp. FMc2]|uniref:FAD-binding oxidoreductase n=1 Tax=Parafrankia sp. FMc2 TaxID=3233196 RepID=UPI0034D60C59